MSRQYSIVCDDDVGKRVERLAREYRSGDLLSGEMKQYAAETVGEFLRAHQERRDALGPLSEELAPFRLSEDKRAALRPSLGE